MNESLIFSIYMSASILTFLPSYWVKRAWSGAHYNGTRMRVASIYIFAAGYTHLNFTYSGEFLYIAIQEHLNLRAISFFFALMHFSRLPATDDYKPWFKTRNRSKNLILTEYPNRSITFADTAFHVIGFTLLTIITSAVFGGALALGIAWLVKPFFIFTPRAFGWLWSMISLIAALLGAWDLLRQRKKKSLKL